MPPYEIKCYKIWWENNPEAGEYVGSTKEILSSRMTNHRAGAKREKPLKIFQAIRKYGYDFNYVMLESCMVNSTDEKRMREQFWIDELKPSLNMKRAYNTEEDNKKWTEENKQHLKQYWKKYNEGRKEDQKIYNKKYHQTHRERHNIQMKQYFHANKEKFIKYNEERRGKYNEYHKNRYQANKDENRRKARERYHAKKLENVVHLNLQLRGDKPDNPISPA